MSRQSKHPVSPVIEQRVYKIFINSIQDARTSEEVVSFLNDLLSSPERVMLAKRVATAFLLIEDKYTYNEIGRALKVSRGTIAKIHAVLALQGKGYRKILGSMAKKKAIKSLLEELAESLTPLPPKGTSLGIWQAERTKRRIKRQKML